MSKDLKKIYSEIEWDLKSKFGEQTIVWVWPEYEGVKGFFGNGDNGKEIIMWITERPSSARINTKVHKFPDWIDKEFYNALKEEGFENMHFTDFVKIMADAGKYPNEEELKISALWIKKEIECIRQEDKKLIIIANSKNVCKWMEFFLPEYPFIYKKFFKGIVRYCKKEDRKQKLKKYLDEINNCEPEKDKAVSLSKRKENGEE